MLVPLESGRFILARVRRAVKCCSPSGFDRVARRASNRLGVRAFATQINIERGRGGGGRLGGSLRPRVGDFGPVDWRFFAAKNI